MSSALCLARGVVSHTWSSWGRLDTCPKFFLDGVSKMKVYPFLILDEGSGCRASFLRQGHLLERYDGDLPLLGMPMPWLQRMRRAFVDWLKLDSERFVDSFRGVDLSGVDDWVVCGLDEFYRRCGCNRDRYVAQVSRIVDLLKRVKDVPVVAYFSDSVPYAVFLDGVVDDVRFWADDVWDRLFSHPKSEKVLEKLAREALDKFASLGV